MASRYADAVSVKYLREKLELLYQSGRVDGDAALARLFKSQNKPNGLTGRTIRQWVQGDGLRDANKIPAHQFGRFVEIVQQRLPGHRNPC